MGRSLRDVAEEQAPAIIFGDAFGNEAAVRRVASDYPDIAFVFGSGLSSSESGVIGVVAGNPVPELNRIVNAFKVGATEVNPDAHVLVSGRGWVAIVLGSFDLPFATQVFAF